MISQHIEAAGKANADLLKALEALQREEIVNKDLVIGMCFQALKRTKDAEGLTPDARKQARSAYRAAGAALGVDTP